MRKKRSYERIIPKKLRDCRLFAIACEGSVREVRYFEQFKVLSSRIDVYMIPETNGEGEIIESRKSSPDHVLKRAERFVHSTGLTEDDQVWIVIDVDRWPMKKLTELEQKCSRRKHAINTIWNSAINPLSLRHIYPSIGKELILTSFLIAVLMCLSGCRKGYIVTLTAENVTILLFQGTDLLWRLFPMNKCLPRCKIDMVFMEFSKEHVPVLRSRDIIGHK